jgi:hypothetical protein
VNRWRFWGSAAARAVTLMACDDGPSGPGDLSVVVESSTGSVAAAVLELRGDGIVEARDLGAVRAFGAETPAGAFRVVAVHTGQGELEFRLHVADVGDALPTATIVEAADPTNRPIAATSQVSVRVVR